MYILRILIEKIVLIGWQIIMSIFKPDFQKTSFSRDCVEVRYHNTLTYEDDSSVQSISINALAYNLNILLIELHDVDSVFFQKQSHDTYVCVCVCVCVRVRACVFCLRDWVINTVDVYERLLRFQVHCAYLILIAVGVTIKGLRNILFIRCL